MIAEALMTLKNLKKSLRRRTFSGLCLSQAQCRFVNWKNESDHDKPLHFLWSSPSTIVLEFLLRQHERSDYFKSGR